MGMLGRHQHTETHFVQLDLVVGALVILFNYFWNLFLRNLFSDTGPSSKTPSPRSTGAPINEKCKHSASLFTPAPIQCDFVLAFQHAPCPLSK